jgi:hypothetical protein
VVVLLRRFSLGLELVGEEGIRLVVFGCVGNDLCALILVYILTAISLSLNVYTFAEASNLMTKVVNVAGNTPRPNLISFTPRNLKSNNTYHDAV